MYLALAVVFFFSLLLVVGLGAFRLLWAVAPWGWSRRWWSRHRRRVWRFYGAWFGCYGTLYG
jgi:hypothetical protein